MKKIFFINVLFGLFIGCERSFDEFSLKRQIYTGDQLRTDGYYYHHPETPEGTFQVLFFYRNGVLLNLRHGFTLENINDKINNIQMQRQKPLTAKFNVL